MWWKKSVILAATLVIAGLGAPAGLAGADPTTPPMPPPPPPPKTSIDADGTYAVGTDIAPGTYASAGPADGSTCYWKRINGETIIDNALTKKPQVVGIEPTDTAFKTSGCQAWTLTDAPAPPAPGSAPMSIQDRLALGVLNGYIGQAGGQPLPQP
jgi:hypothetical protein